MDSLIMDEQKNDNFWVDKAIHIHNVCDKKNFSNSDAKLFVYMYMKIKAVGLKNLLEDKEQITSLKLMLGQTEEIQKYPETLQSDFENHSNYLKKIDSHLTNRTGTEYVIGSELHIRLRFHEDINFMGDKLYSYFAHILPEIEPEIAKMLAA